MSLTLKTRSMAIHLLYFGFADFRHSQYNTDGEELK